MCEYCEVGDYVETKEGVNGIVVAIKKNEMGKHWMKIATADMREYTCLCSHKNQCVAES